MSVLSASCDSVFDLEIPDAGDDTVPVCLKCLTPYLPPAYFCRHCGETVGELTIYMPFEQIPFNVAIFGTMFKRALYEPNCGVLLRFLYLLLAGICSPIIFIAVPFALLDLWRRRR